MFNYHNRSFGHINADLNHGGGDQKFKRAFFECIHHLVFFFFFHFSVNQADGIAEIELDRTNLPTGILFRPKEDAPQKIVYMSFEDLMRRAQGTYMKKQFRVKMYTK